MAMRNVLYDTEFLRAETIEQKVTLRIIRMPPMMAFMEGRSPITRNTHMGLRMGSRVAMSRAWVPGMYLIPYEKSIEVKPV